MIKLMSSASNKRWRAAHPEQWKAIYDAYLARTRESRKLKARRYREQNKEKHQAYRREYRARNREKIREIARAYKYGLQPGEFARVFESQGRKCAICGGTEPRGRGWHTDHDHVTKKLRGILCKPCNTALGTFGDNIQGVDNARLYLDPELPRVDEHW